MVKLLRVENGGRAALTQSLPICNRLPLIMGVRVYLPLIIDRIRTRFIRSGTEEMATNLAANELATPLPNIIYGAGIVHL